MCRYLSVTRRLRCLWHISRKTRNRLAHTTNGNGKGKGKPRTSGGSKGRGKYVAPSAVDENQISSDPIDVTADIRRQVEDNLPDAARLRAQTTLVGSEWSVPVVPWQYLGKDNGIAVVPKQFLPQVIAQVGFTGKSVAAILTEDPDRLGLLGYDRQRVRVKLEVMGTNGERIITNSLKFLVQLGFGEPVSQIMVGEESQMIYTMTRFQCKFPESLGWPSGPLPASMIIAELEKHVPNEAISEIQPRHGDSATFLLHSNFKDTMLKASGRNSIFIKQASPAEELLLLWLEDGTDLVEAIKMAEVDDALGVVRKGASNKPRFAVRFRDPEALKTFAAKYSLFDPSTMGRWKISGIDAAVGTYGLLAWLTARGFKDLDILYVTDGSGVFLASTPGDLKPGFFVQNGTRRQFHFKASNSVAKTQAKQANESERATSAAAAPKAAPKQSERAERQQQFLNSMRAASHARAPKASPKKEASKRPGESTGDTPEPKKANEGI